MDITKINSEKLLSDRRVIQEIERHLWVESEKVGYDVGFENAKADWLKRFSKAWMEYHMPEELTRLKKAPSQANPKAMRSKPRKAGIRRKRRAKSYL